MDILTGTVEKAYILFHKTLAKEENGSELGFTNIKNQATKMAGMDAIASALRNSNSLKESMSNLTDTTTGEFVKVKVHYNPASVSFSGSGGMAYGRNGVGGSQSGFYQNMELPREVNLQMELIFDDTVNSNAFSNFDASNYSPTGIVKEAVNIKGGNYSVKNVTELFVSATTNAYSRIVCVVWNKTVFWGELIGVSAEYTMFNSTGHPIRSKVTIRVRQDGKLATEAGSEDWTKSYVDLEKNSEKLAKSWSLTSTSSNWTNFLNLN